MHDSNRSFAAPSPAPVDQAPSQSQTDPSVGNRRIGCGPGGETQEPGQVESATSSFLVALCAVAIQVLQGVSITDRVARELSFVAAQSANAQAEASQGSQAEVPLSSLGVSAIEQETRRFVVGHFSAGGGFPCGDLCRRCPQVHRG